MVKYENMVRPESCTDLTGENPVLVITGEPGSRLQLRGVIPWASAERRKPQLEGAKERAVTSSERCSLDKVSAERRSRGPSRSCHGEGNRQLPVKPEWEWTSPGYWWRHATKGMCGTGETLPDGRKAKTVRIRPQAESARIREGVRGARSTEEGGQEKPLEGRGSASVVVAKGKREGMPGSAMRTEANNPERQSARTLLQPMDDRQVVQWAMHAALGRPSVSRVLENCKHGLNGRIRKPESPLAASGA